jgi:hypothetical protein
MAKNKPITKENAKKEKQDGKSHVVKKNNWVKKDSNTGKFSVEIPPQKPPKKKGKP